MTKSAEEQPAAVSAKTTPAREILRLIVQVEPEVWTDRMLTPSNKESEEEVVQADRQGTPGTDPGCRDLSSRCEPGSSRGRPSHLDV